MANTNAKTRIKDNMSIFKAWATIAAIVALITGFVVFYVRRNTPEKQHTISYSIGFIGAIACLVTIRNSIKVTKDENGKITTSGDLRGRHSIFIDLLGVCMLCQILSVWTKYALLSFLVIPIYLIYWAIKKLLQWLHYF
jgi:hypothetical protein